MYILLTFIQSIPFAPFVRGPPPFGDRGPPFDPRDGRRDDFRGPGNLYCDQWQLLHNVGVLVRPSCRVNAFLIPSSSMVHQALHATSQEAHG